MPMTLSYASKDYASLLAALHALADQQMPEWTDRSPSDLGVMLLELFAAMGDSLFYNQERVAGESFLDTAVERRSIMQHLRLIGYELRPPLAASADLSLLFAAGASGPITIPAPAAFKTTAAATGAPIVYQHVGPTAVTIDRTALPLGILDAAGDLRLLEPGEALSVPLPPGSAVYRVYQTLPVLQVDASVSGEIVASSDGSAGQRYALARAPLIEQTLVVRVDEGAGPAAWTRVASLLESQPADTHYAVRRDENGTAWIEFGAPPYGRAPAAGFNTITASYCVGGGRRGNVPARTITKPVTAIDQLKHVTNLAAASGGTEAEDIGEAARRGPQQFRAGGRAVTAADYVALAEAFGVAKALALPAGWNRIRLIVAPSGGGLPSETLIQDLQAFLEPRRMMSTVIAIVPPRYVPLRIDMKVFHRPQYLPDQIGQKVRDALGVLLGFEQVQFGQTLYISKLYEVVQDIEGVAGVNIVTFAVESGGASAGVPGDGQLRFGRDDPGELPQWNGFDETISHLVLQPGAG